MLTLSIPTTKRINKLQKWAVRLISNAKYNAHTEPLLKKHKLLKLNEIYKLSACKIFYKFKNSQLPTYFNDIFDTTGPSHNYNTRHRNDRVQMSNTISASHSPRFTIPKVVKEITPTYLSQINEVSLQTFSKNIKQLFISKYSEYCSVYNCYICKTR